MTDFNWFAMFFLAIWFVGTTIDSKRIHTLEKIVDVLSKRIDLLQRRVK